MRMRMGFASIALALLLLAGGCPDATTQRVFATVPGATRFDHFSFVNMTGSPVDAKIELYATIDAPDPLEPATTLSQVQQWGTAGEVRLETDAAKMVRKVVCKVTGGPTCTVEIKPASDPYTISSVCFWFDGTKLCGKALLVHTSAQDSVVIPGN